MPKVMIIGAGPAGSTAGIVLARAGWGVTIVEQARFPREKVCGETLSALGAEVLERVGLLERVCDAGAVSIVRAGLHAPDGRSSIQALPRRMLGLSRARLDGLLLEAAREAGARVLQPVRCEGVGPSVVTRDLVSNETERHEADWVLVADGKAALLEKPVATGDLGIKAHFVDVDGPRDAVELFGVRGHYVGLAPIEEGRWNVAFSVPVSRVQMFGGDLQGLWRALKGENSLLAKRMKSARRVGEFLASPLPRFGVADDWPDRVIPLGNAAAALEPIGGEGIGLAMRSAEIACGELIEAQREGRDVDIELIRSDFKSLWGTRSVACRAMARLLSTPLLAGDVTDWAASNESLSRTILAWMGK